MNLVAPPVRTPYWRADHGGGRWNGRFVAQVTDACVIIPTVNPFMLHRTARLPDRA